MASIAKPSREHLNYKGIKRMKHKNSIYRLSWLNFKKESSGTTDSNDNMDTCVSSSVSDTQVQSTTQELLTGLLPVITAKPSTDSSSSPDTVTQVTFSFQPDQATNRSNVMSSSSKPMPVRTNGKTPTCKVCGDESSGYHYGVDSCEGCKGFFRRCITQGMTHKCSNEEKCEITPFTRNSCQYCRLKKCFAVGMSREASRLGRRPKRLKDSSGEHKRETNLPIAPYPSPAELYKLRMAELQRLLQQNGDFKSELMQAFLTAAQVSFREHQRNNNDNQNNKKEVKKPAPNSNKKGGKESGYSSSSPAYSTTSRSPTTTEVTNQNTVNETDNKTGIIDENVDNFRIVQEANIMDNNKTSSQTADFTSVSEIKSEPGLDNTFAMTENSNSNFGMPGMPDAASPFIMPELSPDTMMMMPDMMSMMEDSSMMQTMMSGMMGGDMSAMMTAEPDDNANEIDVERIMEEVRQVPSALRQQLIEQVMSSVTEAHFATVTPTRAKIAAANERIEKMRMESGMPDLSKLSINPGHMWQKFVQSMVFEITQVVKFCKKLPGFIEINQEDQISLIKKGSFEVLLCRMCLLVDDVNNEMFDPPMEMKCPRQLIKQMPMGHFIDEFFNVASQVNPLRLTDEEVGIFSAALIMCPERDGLQNVQAIEKLNVLFLQSLYVQMRDKHENFEDKFARLLSMIPVFRNVNKKHAMALNSMKMQKAPVIEEFPELHKEIFDIKEDS